MTWQPCLKRQTVILPLLNWFDSEGEVNRVRLGLQMYSVIYKLSFWRLTVTGVLMLLQVVGRPHHDMMQKTFAHLFPLGIINKGRSSPQRHMLWLLHTTPHIRITLQSCFIHLHTLWKTCGTCSELRQDSKGNENQPQIPDALRVFLW